MPPGGPDRKPSSLRRKLWILVIWILALLVVPVFGLWVYIAQPTTAGSDQSDLEVSPERLERHVRMLSEAYAPRSFAHFRNINLTADYLFDEFASLESGGVLENLVFDVGGNRYRNVSLILKGNRELPRVVVGAHYDGFGEFPGADDNASGVAGLIELARLLSESGAPEFPVELVAYPLEEPPHFATREMGSAFHARSLKSENTDVKLMISLEMIGYFSDEAGSQSYPIPLLNLMYPTRGNFIAVIGRTDMREEVKAFKVGMKGTTDVPIYSIAAPASLPGVDFSDHRNYWREGYPALMISNTAFYRNKAYHTAEDTADRLDYDRMSQTVVAVYEALMSLQ